MYIIHVMSYDKYYVLGINYNFVYAYPHVSIKLYDNLFLIFYNLVS